MNQLLTLTSPQHVLSLQQLNDGGLSGRDQDDAAVFSPAHQSTLRGDVDAGCHLRGKKEKKKKKNLTPQEH